MGKRTGLTGISRLALQIFKDSNLDPTTDETEDQPSKDKIARVASSLASIATRPVTKTDLERPKKRRKTNISQTGSITGLKERYDATGLVPYFKHAHEVPDHLKKYFSQRKRYFSRYEEGCLLDEVGWYSVTPEAIAGQIAERCRCDTVLDAFCGVGGNAIAFAKTCERVIALDTSPTRLALARHNASIYGVADRIEFILTDFISFARSFLSLPSQQRVRKIDVVFLSPPWGGPSYLFDSPESMTATSESQANERLPSSATSNTNPHPEFNLASIQPIHGAELFKLSRQLTPNISYYLPRNTNLEEISTLIRKEEKKAPGMDETLHKFDEEKSAPERVEVEEEWMGSKLKALTCYFGGLVAGQEMLFDTYHDE